VDPELPEERRQLAAVGRVGIDDDTVQLHVHVTHPRSRLSGANESHITCIG
jgi:hypothetical protein